MRSIKFRFAFIVGKAVEFKFMSLEELLDCDFALESMVMQLNEEGSLLSCVELEDLVEYELISKDQFTGLTDKNGVEIYEGDVAEVEGLGACEVVICHLYGTSFEREGYRAPAVESLAENDLFKVIGNIHQNPELTEK